MEWRLLAFGALLVAYIHVAPAQRQYPVYSACKGVTIATTGAIIKYPDEGNYDAKENCKWTVDVAGPKIVSVYKFDLEGRNRNGETVYDYVEIRDKYDLFRNGKLMKRWAGKEGFGEVLTINGKFTVKFRSDWSGQREGFRMIIEDN